MKASAEEFLSLSLLYELSAAALDFGDEAAFNELKATANKCAEIAELEPFLRPLCDADYASFSAERNAVFYDFSLVNVPMDASFYDEGRDNGKMRVIAAGLMQRAGLAKANGVGENEDTLNLLFSFAAVLAKKSASNEANPHAKESYEELLSELFERIINEVGDEFCDKLRKHKDSKIFASLAGLIEAALGLSREIFSISAPEPKEHSAADAALNRVPYEPRVPTNFSKINMEEVTSFKGM